MKRILVAAILGAIAVLGTAFAVEAPRSAVAVLPSGREFTLEVAASDIARQRGYMGREKVGPREGMIFVFDDDARHSFWMKDCKVGLDMIWLDVHGRVVWIAANRKPCPTTGDCPSIAPPEPSRYVLEFAEGTAAAESLKPGDAVIVLSDPPLR